MKEYTFVRGSGDKKVIEAMSLKKAIKKYDGKPEDKDNKTAVAEVKRLTSLLRKLK